MMKNVNSRDIMSPYVTTHSGTPPPIFFLHQRHCQAASSLGRSFGGQERIEFLFHHARIFARLNGHDAPHDDFQAEHFLLIDKA